jgi:uncharacterized CHY-type Zn-finger protein
MAVNENIPVKGYLVDDDTRCTHYHSLLDVIAIKFKCCDAYYACYYCHEENAGHPAQRWEVNEFDTKAILCGICSGELTIAQYKAAGFSCPHCNASFNPNCVKHNHLYFAQ